VATTYAFQVSVPVSDALVRNRVSNTFHLQHTIGSLLDTDLESMCQDIVAMWQARYGNPTHEVHCKAYDTDAVPNYPRAEAIVNVGSIWPVDVPREVALCLSWAGAHRGRKDERGRMYLMPGLNPSLAAYGARPSTAALDWALAWYDTPNQSFPDLGGVDWQFGTWSPTYKKFTPSQQAWVNDDWDTMRSRSLRETTRVTSARQG